MISLKALLLETLTEGVLSKLNSIPDNIKIRLAKSIAKWYDDKREAQQTQSQQRLEYLYKRLEDIKSAVEKLGFTRQIDMSGATEIELVIDLLYRYARTKQLKV